MLCMLREHRLSIAREMTRPSAAPRCIRYAVGILPRVPEQFAFVTSFAYHERTLKGRRDEPGSGSLAFLIL
jgi:hypothetical protein